MGLFSGTRKLLHKISGALILAGCLFIVLDAAAYQRAASKRENARCDQIKKIAEALITYKDDPEAVKFYSEELKRLSEVEENYRWKFGSNLSK